MLEALGRQNTTGRSPGARRGLHRDGLRPPPPVVNRSGLRGAVLDLGKDTEQPVDLVLGQRTGAGGRRDHQVADELDLRLEVVVGEVLTRGIRGRHTTNLGPRWTGRVTNPGSPSCCTPTARQVIMCSCPRQPPATADPTTCPAPTGTPARRSAPGSGAPSPSASVTAAGGAVRGAAPGR